VYPLALSQAGLLVSVEYIILNSKSGVVALPESDRQTIIRLTDYSQFDILGMWSNMLERRRARSRQIGKTK